MVQSKALDANLANYSVDVSIEPDYIVLQDVMSGYYGIMDGVNTFLKELSHPHRNWQFIVSEARGYSLNYFHLLNDHPRGCEAAERFAGIFIQVVKSANDKDIKADAADNLLLFIQKIIRDAGSGIEKFIPLIDNTFDRIRELDDENFFLFTQSFYQIDKLTASLGKAAENFQSSVFSAGASVLLLSKYLGQTYDYWLDEDDPRVWFERETDGAEYPEVLNRLFNDISHRQIRQWKARLNAVTDETPHLPLPGYRHFVDIYRDVPRKLLDAGKESGQGRQWKIIFLFHIMNITGLSAIHEEALREINRTLSWIISHENRLNVEKTIRKTFSILKERKAEFPTTALNCVLTMGKGVYKTDESDLINLFINSVIDLGFHAPMIGGIGNDWQVKVNSAHLQNIRTWLRLIELNPKWSTRLISYLIIHLSLCGVFIKDTDLFPRDITRLLNTNIGPIYNLIKQLARLFPVYFNDIGAEGELRDISTRIDEIAYRKDILIHFLRKQIHVEGSSRTVSFMNAVFSFWTHRKKEVLEPFVPPNIYEQIETRGPYIDGIHQIVFHLVSERGMKLPDDILTANEDELKSLLSDFSDFAIGPISDIDIERLGLSFSLCKLLYQKYDLSACFNTGGSSDHYFSMLRSEAFPDINKLREALAEPADSTDSLQRKIIRLLDYIEQLRQLILSAETCEAREDIYKKRHFTVDIPSMYGSYQETKFDALGLTFRLESLVNVLFEELVERMDLSLITEVTFHQIFSWLMLFTRALRADGLSTAEIERQLDFLAQSTELRGFSFTQYIDIFKGFAQAVKNVINDHFNNVHEENLNRILSQIPKEHILSKYLPALECFAGAAYPECLEKDKNLCDFRPISDFQFRNRVSEIFSREKIAGTLGLQQLDIFLSRILNTLFHQAEKLPKDQLQQLLIYDPDSAMSSIDNSAANLGIIYLGNKGLNLVSLRNYGMPVPPGFIITTEVFRFRKLIENYRPAKENFREQVRHYISDMEKKTGKVFGDPKNPLLFSVRSGSSISQPGMMDTFLNVGINRDITAGLAEQTGSMWFAWDCHRRFLQCHGMSFGLKRDDFDAIIGRYKSEKGVLYKRELTGAQMREVALAYRKMIRDSGIDIEDDPFLQLILTIREVLDSWESPKAGTYRKIMGISDDWGTAVTVQAMVYGNISPHSGTGVFFTHNPRWSGDSLRLWGDFTLGNQGEDVVSGLVRTLPISIFQQNIEMRNTDTTLESHFPEIYTALKELACELIYKKGWSPQEMEFTFESPSRKDLYLLQSRDMSIRKRKRVLTFDPESVISKDFIGHGIGVSGGAMSGRAVFTLEEISRWRTEEPEAHLILLRGDTVPDDIREIHAADGILTARGGLTSHAAVVAHRLDKTCVVGCGNLICDERKKTGRFNGTVIRPGDYISIDGREGSIYQGFVRIRNEGTSNRVL